MPVAVVDVRVVRVRVHQRRMTVPVLMRILSVPWKVVAVLMVLIMHVPVGMIEFFMQMLVLMAFGEV